MIFKLIIRHNFIISLIFRYKNTMNSQVLVMRFSKGLIEIGARFAV